jgi:hypothetical protein
MIATTAPRPQTRIQAAPKAAKTTIAVDKKDKSPYNPEFVKMVKEAAASKERYVVENVDELWESL